MTPPETETPPPEPRRMRAWPLVLPDDPDVRALFKGVMVDNMGHIMIGCVPPDADHAVVLASVSADWGKQPLFDIPVQILNGVIVFEIRRPERYPFGKDEATLEWIKKAVAAGRKVVANRPVEPTQGKVATPAEFTIPERFFEEGRWRSCTGCHELDDGHPTGLYADALRCHVGVGCHECGGLGAIYETFPDEAYERAPTPVVTTTPMERQSVGRRAADLAHVIADQPAPTTSNRRAAWDIVLEFAERRRRDDAYGLDGVLDLMLADMRERDRLGRERYGVRLAAGNGRNHLVDAYQEALDKLAYLAAELDEHDLGPETYPDAARFSKALKWHLHLVQQMFWDDVKSALRLRAIIEEKARAT